MWRVVIEGERHPRMLHEACLLPCMITCEGGDRLGFISEGMEMEEVLRAARGVVSVSVLNESVRCSHCERF